MRDYINLTEVGTFDDLIVGMPVMIWDDAKPAKVLDNTISHFGGSAESYFKWFDNSSLLKSGVVGFSHDLHIDQVWIESNWIFMILK